MSQSSTFFENLVVKLYRPWECQTVNENETPRLSAAFRVVIEEREILQQFEYLEKLVEDMEVVSRCVRCPTCGLYFVDQDPFCTHICRVKLLKEEIGVDSVPNQGVQWTQRQPGNSSNAKPERKRKKAVAKPRPRNFVCCVCGKTYATEIWWKRHEFLCLYRAKMNQVFIRCS